MSMKAILNCSDGVQFITEFMDDLYDKGMITFRGRTFVYQYVVHSALALLYQEQQEINHLNLGDDEAIQLVTSQTNSE